MTNVSEMADANVEKKPPKVDQYSPWYTIWTAAVFLLWWMSTELDRIFNLYLLLVPIVFLPALILAATLIVSLVSSVLTKRWRRTMSIIAAPLVAWLPFILLGRLGITPQLIRLEWSKSHYLAEIDTLPTTDGRRLKVWDWGETGGAGVPNIFWTLVYDESDQIALPRSSWSAGWLRRADKAAEDRHIGFFSIMHPEKVGGDPLVSVAHLDGHFYVVQQVYQ